MMRFRYSLWGRLAAAIIVLAVVAFYVVRRLGAS